jgi:hypothetical protein
VSRISKAVREEAIEALLVASSSTGMWGSSGAYDIAPPVSDADRLDAGLVTDISIVLPDREAIDRQLAALKDQGWEVNEAEKLDAESCFGRQEWWSGRASLWEGTRRLVINLHSPSVIVPAEERAA